MYVTHNVNKSICKIYFYLWINILCVTPALHVVMLTCSYVIAAIVNQHAFILK